MARELNAVLFDIDDTLFDRHGAQRGILRLIMDELPDLFAGVGWAEAEEAFYESDRVALQEYKGGDPAGPFRDRRSRLFLRMLGVGESFADRITEMYVGRYPMIDAPVDGARRVVRDLAERFQVGVVSNGLGDVQYRKLDTLGLREVSECIVLSEEFGSGKPEPAIYLHAAALLGRRPEECLYVGDLFEFDVVGAHAAGMHACWLNPTGAPPPRPDIEPDLVIRSLDELPDLLSPGNDAR